MQHVNDLRTQLQVLRGGKQLVARVVDSIEEVEADPQEQFIVDDPLLPRCEHCKQLYGGTRHGWLKRAHGPETNWKTVLDPCPVCSPAAKLAQQEEKAKKSQMVLADIFGDAHIPFYARKWEFSNYPANGDQEAYKVVYDFVQQRLAEDEDARRGLYLGGETGHCKTSLAISALKEAIRQKNESGLFVMTMELMDRLRASYGSKGQPGSISHDDLINAVCSVTWLVLDDLAVEKPTAYVLEKLYHIIEKRRAAGLYTIITSNLSTKQLEVYWRPEGIKQGEFHPGVRVVERIREYCVGVGVKGKNLREGNW